IRIVFPLVRVTPFSFKWTGLPALLGKQQKAGIDNQLFICLKSLSIQPSRHELLVIYWSFL
ncbi:hypothetical protein M2G65_17375, partial [Vibrio vulnificus]|nr:hypothetical protein [Vibrio vulnificus]